MKQLILYTAALLLLLTAACTDKPGSGNGNKDSAAAGNDTARRGLSVSKVTAPVPKNVSDSIFNGDFIERYDNGVIYKRGYIQGGQAQGTWRVFHRNGKLYSQGEYINGVRQGYAVSYDEAGSMTSEGYYKDGQHVGKWVYNLNGVRKEVDYGGEIPEKFKK
jgi:antitoxin component YwqK of YwqJK toxin-antitoxin module